MSEPNKMMNDPNNIINVDKAVMEAPTVVEPLLQFFAWVNMIFFFFLIITPLYLILAN